MQFSLRTLLLLVTGEAIFAAAFGRYFLLVQPYLLFGYCALRGAAFARTHTLFETVCRGCAFVGTGFITLWCVAALSVISVVPVLVATTFGASSTNSTFASLVFFVVGIIAFLVVCGAAAYAVSSSNSSVAGHLAAPAAWLALCSTILLEALNHQGPQEQFDAAFLVFAGFAYVTTAPFAIGGYFGHRAKRRAAGRAGQIALIADGTESATIAAPTGPRSA